MSELIQTYGPIFVDGFKITLFSSVLALVFSLIIGTLMAIFQLSKNKVVSALAKAYVEFFRNIPLLIIVMFFYVVVPIYWFNLDGFQAGTIGLTIFYCLNSTFRDSNRTKRSNRSRTIFWFYLFRNHALYCFTASIQNRYPAIRQPIYQPRKKLIYFSNRSWFRFDVSRRLDR